VNAPAWGSPHWRDAFGFSESVREGSWTQATYWDCGHFLTLRWLTSNGSTEIIYGQIASVSSDGPMPHDSWAGAGGWVLRPIDRRCSEPGHD
jgi:hypothetical protein